MIQFMMADYNATNSKIKQGPYKIVMKLLVSQSNGCLVANKVDIYNPFILGIVDNSYKTSRNKTDDQCCLSLPNTYDF